MQFSFRSTQFCSINLFKHCLLFLTVILLAACISCSRSRENKIVSEKSQVDSLISLAEDSIYHNALFTRQIGEKALKLSKDSMEYYKVLHVMDYYYLNTGQYDSLYFNIYRIINFLQKNDSTEETASFLSKEYNALAVLFAQTGVVDSSLYYNRKSYNLLLGLSDHSDLPDICINTADSYLKIGDYANSTKFFRQALYYCDSLKVTDKLGFPIYFGLANVYTRLKAYDLANQYFDLAEQSFNERSIDERFLFCNNRGNLYYYNKEYDQALSLFQRARKQLPSTGFEFSVYLTDINMSDVYLHLGNADSASYYADKCYPFFKRINHVSALYYLNTIRAGIAMLENKPGKAKEILSSEKIAPEMIEIDMKLIRKQFLQDYYSKIGDYKRAFQILKEHTELSDSIRSEIVTNRIGELDMRYKQDTALLRKDLVIEAQKSRVNRLEMRKSIWIIASGVAALLLVIIYIFLKRQNRLLFNLHIEQTARLRMQNIRNRISPHFVFNVINHQIDPDGNAEKNSQLMELARLLRSSLELSENISITLSQELDFIKTYIRLEADKFNNSLSVIYDLDESVDIQSFQIPSMMIQIQVENAIKHGFAGIEGDKSIQISIRNTGKGASIQVIDNGNGYKPGMLSTKGTGTGLKTILQTIQLLNGKNNEKIEFSISNQELEGHRGTVASMYIPFNYNYKL